MTRTAKREQDSDIISSSSRQERSSREDEISPTIPWMAEEERKTDDLTIVERDRLFSAWSEKRRLSPFVPIVYYVSLRDWDLVFFPVCWDVRVGRVDVGCLDGTEGSSGRHSPLTVAIWAYLAHVPTFDITCPARMEIRPADVRVVRVVHAFTGRVLLGGYSPEIWTVRVSSSSNGPGIK